MLNYIEKLQKKPEYVRRRILHVTVLSLTFVIVLIWISTFAIRFSRNDNDESIQRVSSPIYVFVENGKLFYDDFNRGIEEIKRQFSQ